MKEKIIDYTNEYPKWNDSMKSTHKILIPNMLPWHFRIIGDVLRQEGYDVEILENETRSVIDEEIGRAHV